MMQTYCQNECQLVGEIQDNITLNWTKKGLPHVEFYLKTQKFDSFKTHATQTLRCICKTAHALYIAEKIGAGDRVIVKGALDAVTRCLEDGFYSEVTILVKQCYPFKNSSETNQLYYKHNE